MLSALIVAAVLLPPFSNEARADLQSCRTFSEKGVHASALRACTEVIGNAAARAATRGTALYYRANSRYSTRDLDGALDDVNGALAALPDYGPAYALRAALHLQAGDTAGAEADYTRALQLGYDDPGALSGRATARLDRGDFAGAAADLARVAADAPRNAVARLRLAVALNALGRNDEALAAANRAIALNRDYAAAYGVRAKIRGDTGDLAGALEDFARAGTDTTGEARSLVGKADTLARVGRPDEALAALDEALALEPGNRTAALLKSDLLAARGDPAAARAALGNLAGTDAALARRAARLAIAAEDYGAALADYDRAIGLDAGNAAARFERGQLNERAGEWAAAIADFDRAAALDGSLLDRRLAYFRGKARYQTGDAEGAIADFDTEIARADSADARLWRALALAAIGEFGKAEADALRLVELEPDEARSHAVLGDVLLKAGRLAGGRAAHQKALSIAPGFAPSLQRLRELDAAG